MCASFLFEFRITTSKLIMISRSVYVENL